MKAKVLDCWPAEKRSSLSAVGVYTDIPAYWKNVINASPKELHVGEVVEVESRRDANGNRRYVNIRILTGREERVALHSRALNP